MGEVKHSDKDSFEKYSEETGFVSSIEDWAKKNRHNVYVAVHEHKEIKEQIVSEIKQESISSILDIGCGYGFLISRLNEDCPHSEVTGTDISRHRIMNAKLRRIRGSLVVCCAEYMPFRSSMFNFVVCSEVIEHVVNPKASLLEMERMLKKHGYLCISTDNPLSVYRRIVKLIRKIMKWKTAVKEDFIPFDVLTRIIPNTIKL